jgi:hypothetical protein
MTKFGFYTILVMMFMRSNLGGRDEFNSCHPSYVSENKFTFIINAAFQIFLTTTSNTLQFHFQKDCLACLWLQSALQFCRLLNLWIVVREKKSIFLQLELRLYCNSWTR